VRSLPWQNAGIRFIYFSARTESETKAFGHELELETDWNCCIRRALRAIVAQLGLPRRTAFVGATRLCTLKLEPATLCRWCSLSDEPNEERERLKRTLASSPSGRGGNDEQTMPKLPQGISDVRRHLRECDNVPLLVPMFAETTPSASREMIKILQARARRPSARTHAQTHATLSNGFLHAGERRGGAVHRLVRVGEEPLGLRVGRLLCGGLAEGDAP
jgi:hypothetical protein